MAGTRGANTVAVSTANGTVVPPEHVTNRIPCRRRNGTVYQLVRPRALVMDNCPHTLISVGNLCAQDGFGFWLPTGPEFDAWHKVFSNTIKGTDFPAGIQGKTPPSLVGLAVQIPMEDMQEQMRADVETTTEARA